MAVRFTQGVLWAQGVYAVNEMREQNRAVRPYGAPPGA